MANRRLASSRPARHIPSAATLRRWLATTKGLLLDLDGTLVHSETASQHALQRYFDHRGWKVPASVVESFAGRRAPEVFATTPGPWRDENPDDLTVEVQQLAAGVAATIEPVPGARQLLMACVAQGLPYTIVTSATHGWALQALRLLGAEPPAAGMVTAEDCAQGKPEPEPFIRGAELLHTQPRQLIAIEDSAAGVRSARHAGIGTVVGISTTRTASELLDFGADAAFTDLFPLVHAVAARRANANVRPGQLPPTNHTGEHVPTVPDSTEV